MKEERCGRCLPHKAKSHEFPRLGLFFHFASHPLPLSLTEFPPAIRSANPLFFSYMLPSLLVMIPTTGLMITLIRGCKQPHQKNRPGKWNKITWENYNDLIYIYIYMAWTTTAASLGNNAQVTCKVIFRRTKKKKNSSEILKVKKFEN